MTPATDVPSPAEMTRAWLIARFGSADGPGWSAPGVGDGGEQTFARTGAPMTMCWGCAQEVVAELGPDRAALTGYFCREDGVSVMSEHAEGHDLAIVDGRYLVDGWVAHVADVGPCVLDLADPADLAVARSLHEDFSFWTLVPAILTGMENDRAPEAPMYETKEAA